VSTLSQLRTEAKQRADMVNASFVSDDEWNAWLNRGMQEVYGLTAEVFGAEYYVADPAYTFTTDGINDKFALPSDFFKLLGVDVLWGSSNQWVALNKFEVPDRNKFSTLNNPIPAAGQQLRLLYIPTFSGMATDQSTPPAALTLNGWEEFAVAHAVRLAMAKEESSTADAAQILDEMHARVQVEAENRDAANPSRIIDTRGRGGAGMEYHLWGGKLWLIGWNARGWPGPGRDYDFNGYW
jgi:hypothetical protein